jgi:hypothetical protein
MLWSAAVPPPPPLCPQLLCNRLLHPHWGWDFAVNSVVSLRLVSCLLCDLCLWAGSPPTPLWSP